MVRVDTEPQSPTTHSEPSGSGLERVLTCSRVRVDTELQIVPYHPQLPMSP